MNLNIYNRYDLQTVILKEISKTLGLGSGLGQTFGTTSNQSKFKSSKLLL